MIGFLKNLFGGGANYRTLVKEGAAVVDVRTGPEYDRGHVRGAMNIPLDRIGGRTGEFKTKNQAVICCCESGSRSAQAVSILRRAGVKAYNGGNWKSLQHKLSGN